LYSTIKSFKYNVPPDKVSEIDWVQKGFTEIVEDCKKECLPTDRLGFTLTGTGFSKPQKGYVAFRPVSEISNDVLWDVFGGIIQSNPTSISTADTFFVECTRISFPPEYLKKKSQ